MINDNHAPLGCTSVTKIASLFHAENQVTDFNLFLNDVNVYTHAMKHIRVSLHVHSYIVYYLIMCYSNLNKYSYK
jgi:hypothetical protein